jgi:transcriptional regulator with XRE-family HTH domain|tara:strand:+ start:42 stop:326 length:285 start_codon:yes stop_codon:yes gene_type:complete
MKGYEPRNMPERGVEFVLKGARKRAKMTQKEVARKSGLSKKSIENYECGKSSIPFEKFMDIMDVCRVDRFTVDFDLGDIIVDQKCLVRKLTVVK